MKEDKIHYYDGFFYRKFVDPSLQSVRDLIKNIVSPLSSVIDIGCGTGSLVFELAKACSRVCGIDASSKMIDFANGRKEKENFENVSFIHGGLDYLTTLKDKEFDYATFSMSLHEMHHSERLLILHEATRISKSIIIADYSVPQVSLTSTMSVLFIEFIAGLNHFKSYIDFRNSKGIDSLIAENNLRVIYESSNTSKSIRIIHAKH